MTDKNSPQDDDPRARDSSDDDEDDRPRPRRRRPRPVAPEDDPALGLLIPINTSVLAIFAGYAGLFSVLCFPAPLALLLGILALMHLKKNPKLRGKGRAIFAIVMGTVFTIPLIIWLVAFAADGFK
jgi:hypothetical protein